jgi:multidrug resistance efflux pump
MSDTPNPSSGPDETDDREIKTMRRLTLGAVGLAILVFAYFVLADRYTPFAPDARVQAYVLNMAPEVSGRVSAVAVSDNVVVEQGDLLFRIEQTPYQLAVEKAQARLDQVGQEIGASTAAVDAAQARVHEAQAAVANVEAQTARDL